MITLLFVLSLGCFILTLVKSKENKVNFINGVLLSITIILTSFSIYMLCTNLNLKETLEIFIRHFMKYVIYFIAILFIYNGIYNPIKPNKVRKNNKHDLISFLCGIILIILGIITTNKSSTIYIIIDIILFGIDILFISYALNSIIYKILTKKATYNILIILGCGLIDGEKPGKTLLKRLNKAIMVYKEHKEKPYIIVSGGKGKNEKVSEAEAMKRYLVDKGIEENKIILEDNSKNTYQNLKYSKEKINKIYKENEKIKIAVISSDFHIYRTAVYAKQLGIEIDGIGAKTAWYYYPNSFIREFSAIFVKYKMNILVYLAVLVLVYIIGKFVFSII